MNGPTVWINQVRFACAILLSMTVKKDIVLALRIEFRLLGRAGTVRDPLVVTRFESAAAGVASDIFR